MAELDSNIIREVDTGLTAETTAGGAALPNGAAGLANLPLSPADVSRELQQRAGRAGQDQALDTSLENLRRSRRRPFDFLGFNDTGMRGFPAVAFAPAARRKRIADVERNNALQDGESLLQFGDRAHRMILREQVLSRNAGSTPESEATKEKRIIEITKDTVETLEKIHQGAGSMFASFVSTSTTIGSMADHFLVDPELARLLQDNRFKEFDELIFSVAHMDRVRVKADQRQLNILRARLPGIEERIESRKKWKTAWLNAQDEKGRITIGELIKFNQSGAINRMPGPNGEKSDHQVVEDSIIAITRNPALVSDFIELLANEESLRISRINDIRKEGFSLATEATSNAGKALAFASFSGDATALDNAESAQRTLLNAISNPIERIETENRINLKRLAELGSLFKNQTTLSDAAMKNQGLKALVKLRAGDRTNISGYEYALMDFMEMTIRDPFLSRVLGEVAGERVDTWLDNTNRIAGEYLTQRIALNDLDLRFVALQVLFQEAEVAAADDPFAGGAVVGLQVVQDLLNVFGKVNPAAAAYLTASREFVSILLRARQGSRPSDYDVHFYMAQRPELTEVGAASAPARFLVMQNSLRYMATASLYPEVALQIEEVRRKVKADPIANALHLRADLVFNRYDAVYQDPNATGEEKFRAQQTMEREVDQLRSEGYGRFEREFLRKQKLGITTTDADAPAGLTKQATIPVER